MTVCFPPLIKPDGRFSRIRLSGFLCRRATARRYRVICSCRTLSGAVSPRGPSPHPSLRFSPAEQVASLRSPMFCPGHQRSGMGSSLLRTPPTSVMARAAFPVSGVVPPVESSLPAMTDLPRWGKFGEAISAALRFPAYPSVTSRHVAHRGGRRGIAPISHSRCGESDE